MQVLKTNGWMGQCLFFFHSVMSNPAMHGAFLTPGHSSASCTTDGFLNNRGHCAPTIPKHADHEQQAVKLDKCLCFVVATTSDTNLSTFHPSLASFGPKPTAFVLQLPCFLTNPIPAATSIAPHQLNPTDPSPDASNMTHHCVVQHFQCNPCVLC